MTKPSLARPNSASKNTALHSQCTKTTFKEAEPSLMEINFRPAYPQRMEHFGEIGKHSPGIGQCEGGD